VIEYFDPTTGLRTGPDKLSIDNANAPAPTMHSDESVIQPTKGQHVANGRNDDRDRRCGLLHGERLYGHVEKTCTTTHFSTLIA
jgi:hypothetical protein